MLELLRRRPGFRRLWLAGATSLVGDWLSFVAVGMLAMTGGGGPLALATVLAAHLVPAALVSPVWGALVDRFDRRRLLMAANLAAAAITALMAAAAAFRPGLVPLLLLVRSAITAIVPPAESAALRRLVEPDELALANAFLAGTWSVAFVAGMALGGVAASLGPALAILLDAITFAVAAAIHAMLPAMPVAGRARPALEVLAAVPADTRDALREAASRPALLRAVLGKAPVALAAGAGWIALNLVAASAHPFGGVAMSFGILQAVRGAGTGLGPAGATWLIRRGLPPAALAVSAVLGAFGAIAALAGARGAASLGAVALLWGMGTGTNWVLSHTELLRHSNDAVVGRMAALDELLVTLAMVGSAFVGAAVTVHAGIAAGVLAGTGLGLAGWLASMLVTSSDGH